MPSRFSHLRLVSPLSALMSVIELFPPQTWRNVRLVSPLSGLMSVIELSNSKKSLVSRVRFWIPTRLSIPGGDLMTSASTSGRK